MDKKPGTMAQQIYQNFSDLVTFELYLFNIQVIKDTLSYLQQ